MSAPFFLQRGEGLTVREIAALAGGEPRPGADLDRRITGIASIDGATPAASNSEEGRSAPGKSLCATSTKAR